MKTITKRIFAIAGVLALGLTAVKAQTDGALLDALVKKGVLSDQEAQDIRANEAKEYDTTSASKFVVASYIKNITFYGDGRLRYDAYSQNNYNYDSKNIADRFRYRLRFGLDYTYSDHLKAGFELESATTDDSANQTFGGSFTKASINVGKVYLQYAPTDWLTADVGKFTNPLYTTTDMMWSNDENPEGAAEVFSWTIPLGGSSAPASTDPKAMAPQSAPSDESLTIGLIAAQYDYITSNQAVPTNVANGSGLAITNNNNVGIIATQVPVMWKITKDTSVKLVPGFTFDTGGGNTNFQGGVPANYTNVGSSGLPTSQEPAFFYGTANSGSDPVFYSPKAADDLNIVSVPAEVDFKVGDVPFKVYEDFDWNVTGKQRVQDVYLNGGTTYAAQSTVTTATAKSTTTVGTGSVPLAAGATPASVQSQNTGLGDNVAWAAGLQIGQNKKKGDWSVLGEFRQIGLGSVDPNLNGTDFANSYSNVEGIKTAAAYNFTDFMTGTVTFYDDWAYKNNLYSALGGATATGSSGPDAGTTQYLVSEKNVERVQVDVGWKF
jgi:hypothetical protein